MNNIMPIQIIISCYILIISSTVLAAPSALTAREVMEKGELARKLRDVSAYAMLKNGAAEGAEKIKRFSWYKKLMPDQIHFNTLTRFHFPPEIRDEGILFLEQNDGQAEVMLYLPNFKKIRRVERQAQSGSFMGSEFSYSDISTPHLDDFEYKMLAESAPCNQSSSTNTTIDHDPLCYTIESKPKTNEVRERIGYSRQILWVSKNNFMIVRGEFYGLDSQLIKRFSASDTRDVAPAEHRWMSHSIRIENTQSKKYTVIEFTKVNANKGIDDAQFTPQALMGH